MLLTARRRKSKSRSFSFIFYFSFVSLCARLCSGRKKCILNFVLLSSIPTVLPALLEPVAIPNAVLSTRTVVRKEGSLIYSSPVPSLRLASLSGKVILQVASIRTRTLPGTWPNSNGVILGSWLPPLLSNQSASQQTKIPKAVRACAAFCSAAVWLACFCIPPRNPNP